MNNEEKFKIKNLVNRLQGVYPVGPILDNGEPEFGWRDNSGVLAEGTQIPLPIMLEAAFVLEETQKEIAKLKAQRAVYKIMANSPSAKLIYNKSEKFLSDQDLLFWGEGFYKVELDADGKGYTTTCIKPENVTIENDTYRVKTPTEVTHPNAYPVNPLQAAIEIVTKIAKWHGEFPVVKDGTYALNYGSNGERDFMRNQANVALDYLNDLSVVEPIKSLPKGWHLENEDGGYHITLNHKHHAIIHYVDDAPEHYPINLFYKLLAEFELKETKQSAPNLPKVLYAKATVEDLKIQTMPLKFMGFTPKFYTHNAEGWAWVHEEKPTHNPDKIEGWDFVGEGYEIGDTSAEPEYIPKVCTPLGNYYCIEIIDHENIVDSGFKKPAIE